MWSILTDLACDFDIISLLETFLSPNSSVDYLHIPGYQNIISRDRLNAVGDGVAFYVSSSLHVLRRLDLEKVDIELLWCKIRLHNNKFLFGICYRPPNSPVSFWDQLQESLDLAKSSGIFNIILMGDLNYDIHTQSGPRLHQFAWNNFLSIHVNEPTRITEHSATCLDQIL